MSITRAHAISACNEAIKTYGHCRAQASAPDWRAIWCMAVEWAESEALAESAFIELPPGVSVKYAPITAFGKDARVLDTPGYAELADVLSRAFHQAASGKGKERHAQGEPFTEQVMQDMARRFGVGALLGQAFKKSEESQRLPHERAVAELLGAINYLAGAVIALEAKQKPANDNESQRRKASDNPGADVWSNA